MPSSDSEKSTRGYIPPKTDEERFLMRHAEDLAHAAKARGICRYSGFLSDREQLLCEAAMHRADCTCFRFDGGYAAAERKLLCVEPEDAFGESPLRCVRICCRLVSGATPPQHKDYLGSLMGLEIRRESIGDIVPDPAVPGTAYLFVLNNIVPLLQTELTSIGKFSAFAEEMPIEALPALGQTERVLRTATVSSLRLDAVLAAMLHCSRGTAGEYIASGRVEINHVEACSAHAAVYVEDVFTIRGKGRYQLTRLPGTSRKDRQIIEFFQY